MRFDEKRFVLGIYDTEDSLVHGAHEAKKLGYNIYDIYTPYPVHGLDDLLNIKRTRLPIVCFIAGGLGLLASLYFQYWTSAVSWPVNIGGKSMDSYPAFIPVSFEITVLFGAFITVFAFLFRNKLFPGSKLKIPDLRATDDRFILAIEHKTAELDLKRICSELKDSGASEVAYKEGSEWIA